MDGIPLITPRRGVSDASAFFDQSPEFTAPGSMLNCWLQSADEKRPRIGQRPGLSRVFNGALGAGPIQAMISVQRPSVSNLRLGQAAAISGSDAGISSVLGNYWLMTTAPAMQRMGYFDVTGDSGPANNSCVAPRFTSDGSGLIVATNYLKGGYTKARVRRINVATGATVWTYDIETAATHRFVNSLSSVAEHGSVAVCTNQYVLVLNADTGALITSLDMNGWSQEAIACDYFSTGAFAYLLVAFNGSQTAGTLPNLPGVISPGIYAGSFRSGLMLYQISAGALYGQVAYGTRLGPTDAYYESDHRYARVSEFSSGAPHGCNILGMTVAPDGRCVVLRSNQGWGPTSAYRPSPNETDPDGSTGRPYISAFCLDPTGALLWENNNAASVTDEQGEGSYAFHPHYNDILTPSFQAIAMDAHGNVCVGGRTNQFGYSVYALDTNGLILWNAKVMGTKASLTTVRETGVCVDPTDGNFVLVGDRNDVWDDATGAPSGIQANLWKLNGLDGTLVYAFDLLKGVSGLGVAAGGGKLAYTSDYAS